MLLISYGFLIFCTHLASNLRYALAQVPLLPAYLKSGYCPTVPIDTYNTIDCIDDTGCPGIARCCPTIKGNKCLVPSAQPPRGTSQPCGGANEQWESCATPCPASCEYSTNSYDIYRGNNPFYSRGLLGGCTGCVGGCTCISGYIRERLQGNGACVLAGASTCAVASGNGQSVYNGANPFDYYARYAYPNGLRYPPLYWNTLLNRNAFGGVAPGAPLGPLGSLGPFGPLGQFPISPVGPTGPLGPPQISPRYPYYYPDNAWAPQQPFGTEFAGPADPFLPYDKRSKDDKKNVKEEKQVTKDKKEEKS